MRLKERVQELEQDVEILQMNRKWDFVYTNDTSLRDVIALILTELELEVVTSPSTVQLEKKK